MHAALQSYLATIRLIRSTTALMRTPADFAGLTTGSGRRIGAMTWDEVERRIKAGAVAILPIGAGSKEHGLHLPLNTDQIQAEFLAAHLAGAIDALIWPTVTYGHYPAFADYPGSSSLSTSAFEALIGEIAAGILASGLRALVVIDTGISTIAPVERALARFADADVVHLRVHQGPTYRAAASRLVEQPYGSHADELETSLMLAIAPDVVEMSRAQASPAERCGNAPGPLTRTDASSPNYSASGSFGDPTKASRAKGDSLLAAMLEDMREQTQRLTTERHDIQFSPASRHANRSSVQ